MNRVLGPRSNISNLEPLCPETRTVKAFRLTSLGGGNPGARTRHPGEGTGAVGGGNATTGGAGGNSTYSTTVAGNDDSVVLGVEAVILMLITSSPGKPSIFNCKP